MRKLLEQEKPDAVLLFTDPRFFVWVWEMEDEIRAQCPILYWHVWDNDPTPTYNKAFYESTDFVVPLSLKTYGILQDLKYPKDRFKYIPHAVSSDIYKKLPEAEVQEFRKKYFGPHADKEFVVFWNNRNARRKMTGDVIGAFAKFADKVGRDKVALAMHTQVRDPEGQNLVEVAKVFSMEKNLIISEERLPASDLNKFYNAADCTLSISNNEGFGLGTLESLMAGTPITVLMTGGLQFQIGDWWEGITDFTDQDKLERLARSSYKGSSSKWYGEPIFPDVRSCVGSQPIPFIYDDRSSYDSIVTALLKLFHRSPEEREKLGEAGAEWARKAFGMEQMISGWDEVITRVTKEKRREHPERIRVASL
jgi:glycosyltransferase involved in cell wall biosynthesis